MSAYCQPVSRNVAEAMLQVVARALCDRSDEGSELHEGRTHQLVTTALGLAPRDGVELMLATLAFGHFQVILDSMSDVFRGQADALKAKTKTTIVPLGRAMLEMLKELRQMQARPTVQVMADVEATAAAETRPRQTTAPVSTKADPEPAEPVPTGPAPVDPAPSDPAPSDLPSTHPASTDPASTNRGPPDPVPLSEAELATLSDPRLGLPAEVIAWLAGTGPASPDAVPQEPQGPGSPAMPPTSPEPGRQRLNIVPEMQPSTPNGDNTPLPVGEDAGTSVEAHIALRAQPLSAAYETLAQQSARIAPNARAASGD